MRSIVVMGLGLMLTGGWMSSYANDTAGCTSAAEATSVEPGIAPLPMRDGPRIKTSGRVPHVQVGFEPVAEVNRELFRLAFTLPGVEERPTVVSLPGATGMWLADGVPVIRPKAIVSGREFSHLHPDGSLHAPLPFERALELEKMGWGERHPWASRRDGWEGFVMLYSASSMEELKILFQLVSESYNFVTGQNFQAPNC